MILPPIVILMTTWAPDNAVGRSRARSAQIALSSWAEHLRYPRLGLHIADDGSTLPGHVERLHELGIALGWEVTTSRQERGGVGASLNAGIAVAARQKALALYAVDDWALTADLDLIPWAELLQHWAPDVAGQLPGLPSVGCVRLGPPHPDQTGRVVMAPSGWALLLDRHHFVAAQRPALWNPQLFDVFNYGPWPENCSALECERIFNERFCDPAFVHGPGIVQALPHPWAHVGDAEVGDITPGAMEVGQ
jgi:hypothetical protein